MTEEEQRIVDAVTTKLTGQFHKGQRVCMKEDWHLNGPGTVEDVTDFGQMVWVRWDWQTQPNTGSAAGYHRMSLKPEPSLKPT